jgi:hypothetical protein
MLTPHRINFGYILLPSAPILVLDECEQIGVHLILQRCAQAVWRTLVDFQSRALDKLGLEHAGVGEWHDLVVVPP